MKNSTNINPLQLIIVMGVSGSGKSSIAEKIADKLGYLFVEADDFHPEESKEWMALGNPLTNEMREPWIISVQQYIKQQLANNVSCVLSYSGLIKSHRDIFRQLQINIQFLFLDGSEELIKGRLNKRQNHFFNPSLLHSQFVALERPLSNELDIKIIDISESFEGVYEKCLGSLG
ncbi:gluconokinase, GntK/IdnK-type [Colwellia sp. UCD-KL20]|uniref:gluconokinase n=1 Tax=Colwellia sp. UCD-KL20 TaxID=1917165 RepID=UPI00097067A7|nr:gluconokinase, GntK/IdnK-type [Colwellia sp. UCD-KL20]